jgi:hypothetical protein
LDTVVFTAYHGRNGNIGRRVFTNPTTPQSQFWKKIQPWDTDMLCIVFYFEYIQRPWGQWDITDIIGDYCAPPYYHICGRDIYCRI